LDVFFTKFNWGDYMTDRDLLETILLKLGNLEIGQSKLEAGQQELRSDVQGLQKNVIKIEETIHDKVGILFDADTHTQEKLERIETKLDVLQMEAASIRRIK